MQAKSVCARTGGRGSKIRKSEFALFMDDPLTDLSHRYKDAKLMFLFSVGLFHIIGRLSSTSNKYILFS